MSKKIIALMLAVITVFSIAACGPAPKQDQEQDQERDQEQNATDSIGTESETRDKVAEFLETYNPENTAESYVEEVDRLYDFKGHEFKFLNSAPIYSMYIYLAPDATGDVLDEACVLRNIMAQEKFNITITEETQPYAEIAAYAQTLIQSGEDVYDAMYIGCQSLAPMITENLFVDLMEMDQLNLDKIWWDQPLITRNIIGDRLFYATSDLHLMAFEGVWAIYFSEGMMTELGLEFPYQAVQEGKWTIEMLQQYCKEAANLNGDQSFSYDLNGSATYGIATDTDKIRYMLYGMNSEYVERDETGRYQFTAATDDKFKQSWEVLINLWGPDNGIGVFGSGSDLDDTGYFSIFMDGRSMFLSAELKGATILREWEGTFGLLPQAKYDENQESYESTVFNNVLSFCVPTTNTEFERTAIITDYLTYESYRSLLPRYYDIHVGLKALTREESKMSLEYIRNSRGIEVSIPYEWTHELSGALVALAKKNSMEIESTIETYREACITAINKTYEQYPLLNSIK